MTHLEEAAIRFTEADLAARVARKALRVGWHSDPMGGKDECLRIEFSRRDATGLLVDHLRCRDQSIPREEFCCVCAGRQDLWERMMATKNARTGALLHLRALVAKVNDGEVV